MRVYVGFVAIVISELYMKTTIQYLRHSPGESDGFYHAKCPVLYAQHDTITALADCPFPLVTDSFRVLLFGTSKSFTDDDPKHGNNKTFAVVEHEKVCGHTVQERIQFIENVKTFDHYGKIFAGESYSIKDWRRRIECFRNYPCDVCAPRRSH